MALSRFASDATANLDEVVAEVEGRRAVFLDRDGVINRAFVRAGKPYPPQSLADVVILTGVGEALEKLRAAGFLNVIVTNQPDVATGKQRREVVETINDFLRVKLALDAVKVCYHSDADGCQCRKPKPGMILDASHEMGIDIGKSYLVGDRWRDIAAAQAAGCKAFLIDRGYKEKMPEKPYVAVNSLAQAARIILRSD